MAPAPGAFVGLPERGIPPMASRRQGPQAGGRGAGRRVVARPWVVAAVGLLADAGGRLLTLGRAEVRVGRMGSAGYEDKRALCQVVDALCEPGVYRRLPDRPQLVPGVADHGVVLCVLDRDQIGIGAGPIDDYRHSLPVGLVVEAGDARDRQARSAGSALRGARGVVRQIPPVVEVEEVLPFSPHR